MTFIDARLPPRIAAGFKGGPQWSTLITPMRNGHERRNKSWDYAQYRYVANFGAFSEIDRQALLGIFQAAGGRWAAFRFRDPTDYFVTNEPLSPEIGSSTPVQLVRAYSFGPQSSTRPIKAPVAGTVTVYRGATPVTGTLDAMTGLFTPSGVWVAGTHTWSGQHDLWVRFDSDWGAFVANAKGLWTADMELLEVRS